MAGPLREGDPTTLGPYRLRARLGGGGMGQVYLGRSPGGRLVAVKVVRPELADNAHFRRRFASEVEAARKVGGFYTAQVVDADTDGDPPWLATAYIPGPSLQQAVDEHGPLPLESVAVLGAGLAEGLTAVHACEVVHRDLKPANVILAEDGPRLIDFGIARALDATSHTQTSTVMGTAAFMSPEQALGRSVGPASDVFSLGCVLAFAATGRSPFGEGPANAILFRVVHAQPDLAGVPGPLAGLVAECLAKDPAARPSVRQVLDRLTQLASPMVDGVRPGWLPEALTEVVTRQRTKALTVLDGPESTPRVEPVPPGRVHGATAAMPSAGHVERPGGSQSLLVNERRRRRGNKPVYPASGREIAVYVLLAFFTLLSVNTLVQQLIVLTGKTPLREVYSGLRYEIKDMDAVMMVVQAVVGAALVVCWVLWFSRARAKAETFAPGRLRYSRSMAVFGWFIPLANLFLPKQIADDVWHASSPPEQAAGPMAPAGLLNAWWALWLTTFVTWPLFWVPWSEFLDERLTYYHYTVEPLGWVSVALRLLGVATAVVAALYVRRLSKMQAVKPAA